MWGAMGRSKQSQEFIDLHPALTGKSTDWPGMEIALAPAMTSLQVDKPDCAGSEVAERDPESGIS